VWRHAWGDGAYCPSTARHAARNDQVFAGSLSKITNLEKPFMGKLAPEARNFVLDQAAGSADCPCNARLIILYGLSGYKKITYFAVPESTERFQLLMV
jgi:hypothetical protein